MKFHVSMNYGISKEFFSNTKESLVHGSLQGSGNAGTEWCNISTPILQTYYELTEGYTIIGPTKKGLNQ